jgi:DNA-binding transcriptional LysR family regulator
MDECLDAWWAHHFPKRQRQRGEVFSRVATINSIEGAITLVKAGVGVTFIPRHCVAKHLGEGSLVIGKGRAAGPAINQIFIITLAGSRPPQRVQQVIDWFLDME